MKIQRAGGLFLIQMGLFLYVSLNIVGGGFLWFAGEFLTSASDGPLGGANVMKFAQANFVLMFTAIFAPRVSGGIGIALYIGWSIWVLVAGNPTPAGESSEWLAALATLSILGIPSLLIALGIWQSHEAMQAESRG